MNTIKEYPKQPETQTMRSELGIVAKRMGRPPLPGKVRRMVSLDLDTVTKARELGQGNVSKGIRRKFAETTPVPKGQQPKAPEAESGKP